MSIEPVKRRQNFGKPKKSKKPKMLYPAWPIGEVRMASVPVTMIWVDKKTVLHDSGRGKPHLHKAFEKSREVRSVRWFVALVERRGLNRFVVLRKSVAPYNEPNPGNGVVLRLAEEFGVSQVPSALIRFKHGLIEGL